MYNDSIWKINLNKNNKLDKDICKLNKDISADVLVIGGGIAGLTLAYFLRNKKNVVLIDKGICGMGISANSSAKLTYVQENIYNKISQDKREKYLKSQREAINIVKDIVKDNNIRCDLEYSSSYLFTEKESEVNKIKKEENFYEENGIKVSKAFELPINFPCKYAIRLEDTYVFNPLKYLIGIKNVIKDKVSIYEETKAIKISKKDDGYEVFTEKNKIKAKIVVVCTHYPFFTYPLFIPFKTNIERSYLLALEVSENKKFNAINLGNPTYSIRYITINKKNYLLYVTNSHSISCDYDKEIVLNNSIESAKKYFGDKIYTHFTNQDILTIDNIPYIGMIMNNMYVATGFNTWGMTNGTISGKVISDLIINGKSEYQELFNPKRLVFNIGKLTLYNYNNGVAYVLSKIITNYSFYRDRVFFKRENGKRIGIYIDDNGMRHEVIAICPHLGCNLIFNMEECTWDCPCHGSRFDYYGHIINGPSKYNIIYKK